MGLVCGGVDAFLSPASFARGLGPKSLLSRQRRARGARARPCCRSGAQKLARFFLAKQVFGNPAFCPLGLLFHTHNPNPLAKLAGDKKASTPPHTSHWAREYSLQLGSLGA